jgi:hypothetical protein
MAQHLSPLEAMLASIGDFRALGVLVATTSVNNLTTAAPFNSTGDGLKGKVLMLQPDTACWIKTGASDVAATTSATGSSVKVAAEERVIVRMSHDSGYIAAIAVAGTSNVRVFEMT